VQLNAGINAWHNLEFQDAKYHLDTAEQIEPAFCQVNYWYGRLHLNQSDYNAAIER
jgi:hypothetical protein